MELDAILSDKEPPARDDSGKFAAAAAPAEAAPETPVEAPKAEAAPEVKAEAPKAPKVELTAQERAFLARAQDESRKRQAMERELNELRAKVNAAPPQPEVPFWENPDEALKRHQESIQSVKAEVQNMMLTERVTMSEAAAREKYKDDFDAKVGVFMQMAQESPNLLEKFTKSHNPAEFAYTMAKNKIELDELGNIDQVMAKRDAVTRAQMEAEFAARLEAERRKLASIPPSLSEVNGATGNNGRPVWSGPTPLDAILARR